MGKGWGRLFASVRQYCPPTQRYTPRWIERVVLEENMSGLISNLRMSGNVGSEHDPFIHAPQNWGRINKERITAPHDFCINECGGIMPSERK